MGLFSCSDQDFLSLYVVLLFILLGLFTLAIVLYCVRRSNNKALPPEQQKSISGYKVFLLTTGVLTGAFILVPILVVLFIFFVLSTGLAHM